MIKIKIYTIGKNKEPWLQEALGEYEQRLSSTITIEWIFAKNESQLQQLLAKEPQYVCLDPKGKLLTSEAFSVFFFRQCGARIQCVIGGATGLPPEITARASHTLSLSPLTFTHQLTRLILLEQLYRAMTIDSGIPYHK